MVASCEASSASSVSGREGGGRIATLEVGPGRVVGRDAGVQVPQDGLPVGQLLEPAPLELQFVPEQEPDEGAHLGHEVVPGATAQPDGDRTTVRADHARHRIPVRRVRDSLRRRRRRSTRRWPPVRRPPCPTLPDRHRTGIGGTSVTGTSIGPAGSGVGSTVAGVRVRLGPRPIDGPDSLPSMARRPLPFDPIDEARVAVVRPLGSRRQRGHGGRDVDHAGPADRAGRCRRGPAPVRTHLRPLRGTGPAPVLHGGARCHSG